MASAEVMSRPPERTTQRKPFTQWVKNLASRKHKGGDQPANTKKHSAFKSKRSQTFNGTFAKNNNNNNNPYPESGHFQQRQQRRASQTSSANGQLSVARTGSYGSLPTSANQEREGHGSNRSGAPTLATNPDTVHSDAGHSKAATSTTRGGGVSSMDGAGADSTFSSPDHSQHSLTTTLTTIQSTGAGNTLQAASGPPNQHHHPVMFSHQYPVSPTPSTGNAISAIPRHVSEAMPSTYNSATANGLLSDNASVITLASSSKRRRRSMDTDASVRALAPSSVFGGSRESLPLSVLSGHVDHGPMSSGFHPQSRASIGGLASTERASIYSSQGVGIASERNSYYSHKPGKDLADAKSLRSMTNMDARSVNADAKSMGDVGSVQNYEGSVRSSKLGHNRNDSIPGSANAKHASGGLSRRSSDWQQIDTEDNEGENEKPGSGEARLIAEHDAEALHAGQAG